MKNAVASHRSMYGRNKVTHEKKSPFRHVSRALYQPFHRDTVLPGNRVDFHGYPCSYLSANAGRSVTADRHHHSDNGIHFRNTALCAGIPPGNAAEKLLAMITTTCTVTRKDGTKEIPLDELVVGDIIHLSAGDMVPADVRVLEAKDLFISQSALTGESNPIEKIPVVCEQECETVTDYTNIAFMGSNVISGSATAVVISVGDDTPVRIHGCFRSR